MRQDEIERGVLLVYKTRNQGYFNYRMATPEVKDMPHAARLEFTRMLRNLADDIDTSDLTPRQLVEYAAINAMNTAFNVLLEKRLLAVSETTLLDLLEEADKRTFDDINTTITQYAPYMRTFGDDENVR
jgi:hypothetical protein